MFSVELTDVYRSKLDEIVPNFQENLRRGFNNEGARMQNSHKGKIIPMQDVAISDVNGIYTLLKNMNLTTYPEFRVKHFNVDLENACIDVRFYIGQVTLEADMQMINKTMFKNMAMVVNNKVQMHLTGMEAKGRIGLFSVEDSFVPKNYYIDYTFESGEVEKINATTGKCIERATFSYQDFSPFTLIIGDLTERLDKILHRQLGSVIVEYSLNELLLDEDDETRDYKEYLRKNVLKANMIIDVLVDKAKNMSLFKGGDLPTQFILPHKQDSSSTRNTMRGEGVIAGIDGITRPSDWSLHENESHRVLYGYLRIKDYKFTYDYMTEYMNSTIEGTIKATIYKAKFSMELKLLKDTRDCLGTFRSYIAELNDIEIDISGLGSLSWLESRIRSIVIGHIRWETRNKVAQFMIQQLTTAYSELDFI